MCVCVRGGGGNWSISLFLCKGSSPVTQVSVRLGRRWSLREVSRVTHPLTHRNGGGQPSAPRKQTTPRHHRPTAISVYNTIYQAYRVYHNIYYICSTSKCIYNIIYTNTENACILYVYINFNSVNRHIFTLIAPLQSSTASPE